MNNKIDDVLSGHAVYKSDLALMFFNYEVSAPTALRQLNNWIRLRPDVQAELELTHYNKYQRILTPAQVTILMRAFG